MNVKLGIIDFFQINYQRPSIAPFDHRDGFAPEHGGGNASGSGRLFTQIKGLFSNYGGRYLFTTPAGLIGNLNGVFVQAQILAHSKAGKNLHLCGTGLLGINHQRPRVAPLDHDDDSAPGHLGDPFSRSRRLCAQIKGFVGNDDGKAVDIGPADLFIESRLRQHSLRKRRGNAEDERQSQKHGKQFAKTHDKSSHSQFTKLFQLSDKIIS